LSLDLAGKWPVTDGRGLRRPPGIGRRAQASPGHQPGAADATAALRTALRAGQPWAGPPGITGGGHLGAVRLEPGALNLGKFLGVTEAGEDVGHLDRIRCARRAAFLLDGETRPREEGAPIVRLQPRPRRNRHLVEVVADELFGGGAHAPIIPL
jgi:hypothetical protein